MRVEVQPQKCLGGPLMKTPNFARLCCLAAFVLPAALQGSIIVTNFSFETPLQSVGGFTYNPTGAGVGWSFAGSSGIAATNSPWFNVAAPNGTQAAFLQANSGQNPTVGAFSESITGLTIGDTYQITFNAAMRSTVGQSYPADVFSVSLGGTSVGSFTPLSSAFVLDTTATIVATSTSEVLLFQSTSSGSVDSASIIDAVVVTDLTPTTGVPEPGTFFLFVPALGGLAFMARRRLKA
jgi:hypothetical protein